MTNPADNLNPQPIQPDNSAMQPAQRPKRPRLSCGCASAIFLVSAVVFLAVMFFLTSTFGDKVAPDYPNATKSELTAQGNQFVDSLYKNNKREDSVVKVFLTKDPPQQVLSYYTEELTDKDKYKAGERPLSQLPGAIVIAFTKDNLIYALITSNNEDGLVKNQQPGDTYIIIAQGRS